MSIALLIATAVLALAGWLSVMYVWWRTENGVSDKPALAVANTYVAACIRLSRRGWYACTMYAKAVGIWGNKKMQKVFFALFPSAEPAFAKRDELVGLKDGPTSYFLRTISEKETIVLKRTPKKIFS
jgi:hypothetical protein